MLQPDWKSHLEAMRHITRLAMGLAADATSLSPEELEEKLKIFLARSQKAHEEALALNATLIELDGATARALQDELHSQQILIHSVKEIIIQHQQKIVAQQEKMAGTSTRFRNTQTFPHIMGSA